MQHGDTEPYLLNETYSIHSQLSCKTLFVCLYALPGERAMLNILDKTRGFRTFLRYMV